MKPKIVVLFCLLALASLCAGGVFGLLDIFGFIDGRHTLSFQLLLSSAALVYIIVVTAFLLNYASAPSINIFFSVCSLAFGIPFFVMNQNILLTLLSMIVYFIFLLYTYHGSHRRSLLFIRFMPTEIFFPVLKASFTFFLIFLALITYSQSRDRVVQNNLVSPELVGLLSKPTIYMLNQQVNNQLHSGASATILESVPVSQRNVLIQTSLEKTLIAMEDPQSKTVYGLPTRDIPLRKAHISPQGMVDFTPVLQAILPNIADLINMQLQKYALLTPFLVALFIILFLQPIIFPLRVIEALVTLLLFKILLLTKCIQITTRDQAVEVPYL